MSCRCCLELIMSQLELITFNTQRNFSWRVIQSIIDIVQQKSESVLCLQEITPHMSAVLRWRFPRSVSGDQNMIIAPAWYTLRSHGEFYFEGSWFLRIDVENATESTHVITGKLPHGMSFLRRKKILESLLALSHMDTTVLALDTNMIFPFERRGFLDLLRQYWFSTSSHPAWTYVLSRLEWNSLLRHFLRFLGRYKKIKPQLDVLIHTDDIALKKTHVLSEITSSDHEPVYGVFDTSPQTLIL